jgi:hypothetical protein
MPIDLDNLYDANGNRIDPDELSGPSGLRQHAKSLEEQLKEERERAEKLPDLERENAFLKAGINPEDEKAGYFVRGYQGEVSSDAIKAAWQDFAGTTPDLSGPSAVAAAAAGSSPVPGGSGVGQPFETDPDGYNAALAATGGNQDKVLGVMREWGSPVADIDD